MRIRIKFLLIAKEIRDMLVKIVELLIIIGRFSIIANQFLHRQIGIGICRLIGIWDLVGHQIIEIIHLSKDLLVLRHPPH
jgi:hypothetical protein